MAAPDVSNHVRIGSQLPSRELALSGDVDVRGVLDLAMRWECEGAESLWIGESVTARPRLDAYTMLAALAAVTTEALLGSSVMLPALRPAIAFAHQVATIDQLSQGRLIVGAGAGGPIPGTVAEFAHLQQDYKRRISGLEATITAARALWSGSASGEPVDDPTGRFGFEALSLFPPAFRPSGPPIWLATGTPQGLERCGRSYDGWMPYPSDPADYARGCAAIDGVARAAGRDPGSIERGLFVTVATGSQADNRMEEYNQRYYRASRQAIGSFQLLITGSVSEVCSELARFVDAGAGHLIIRHATFDPGGHCGGGGRRP